MMKCHYRNYTRYRGLKVPQCGSNFTRSWLPCEVKSASAGWWLDFEELTLNMKVFAMQNKNGLIFVAQSKLTAFYWKTSTFHGFGQMCLSEVLCLMMFNLGGRWHKSQQLTQLQLSSETHVACTFLWEQQHRPYSKCLGGLWSIDFLKLLDSALFVRKTVHKHNFLLLTDSHRSDIDSIHLASFGKRSFKSIWSEIEMMKCHYHNYTRYRGLKVPQCGSNLTRSWLPCEVKSASAGWWLDFEELTLNMKASMINWQTEITMRVPTAWIKEFAFCTGTVCCIWMRAKNFWNKLWIC